MGCVVDRLWAGITARSIRVSAHYRLIVFAGIHLSPGEQDGARNTSQIPAHRDAARNRILLVERIS
jgi:hypothetical protein